MKTKQISLYIDEKTYDKAQSYIKEHDLKPSECYRDIFKFGLEQKAKKGNYFTSNEYILEMLYRNLMTLEHSQNIDNEFRRKCKAAAEDKITDLLTQ